jgi:hypothetical protein
MSATVFAPLTEYTTTGWQSVIVVWHDTTGRRRQLRIGWHATEQRFTTCAGLNRLPPQIVADATRQLRRRDAIEGRTF